MFTNLIKRRTLLNFVFYFALQSFFPNLILVIVFFNGEEERDFTYVVQFTISVL